MSSGNGLKNGEKRTLIVNLFSGPSGGKCFAQDTEVLMYDGTIKKIQDIQIGDLVMGDDSTPRTVLNLHRGQSKLYKLHIKDAFDITVSERHILCITRQTRNERKKNRKWVFEDITIEDYFKKSNHYKEKVKFYCVPIEYPEQKLEIDPYYLGLWLGDGLSSDLNRISINDPEILEYCKEYAESLGLVFKQTSYKKQTTCQTYSLSQGNIGHVVPQPLVEAGRLYNLAGNKHIPLIYLTSSREQRLQLLAGLLDTDGYCYNNCYEITQKNEQLSKDIYQLCFSLGFRCTMRKCVKHCQNNFSGEYYKMGISGGGLSEIPTRVKRKQVTNQHANKDAKHHGFTVEECGYGNYCGIETDGNKHFLLPNCMVVHNSTGAAYIFTKLKMDYIDAELVTEFAKDKTWEKNQMVLSNQFYVFGKQAFRLARVAGQVDVAITDSPLLLSNYYAGDAPVMENFKKACVDVFNTYDNVNFFLNRVKPYNPNGRSQTEAEADEISAELKQMLNSYSVLYEEVNGDESGYEMIYQYVKMLLGQRGVVRLSKHD